MGTEYEVEPGDCIESIAFAHGFFWKTLWQSPENSALRQKRKHPNVLLPGDLVMIPQLHRKETACGTDKKHVFRRKGVPSMFRVRLVRQPWREEPDAPPPPEEPRAQLPYVLTVDGKSFSGKTDGDGWLQVRIAPNALHGELTLAPGTEHEEVIALDFGHVDPVEEISGVQQRLNNLGFPCEPTESGLNPETTEALEEFQRCYGLPVTGEPDEATRAKLLELHRG